MRRKEMLYAVIGGIVGTVLTMAAGALAPLGAQDEPVDLNAGKITCRELDVVDADGNLRAGLNASEYGGSVFVAGEKGKGAAMHLDEFGGKVYVEGKEGKELRRAAMSIDGDGGEVSVWGKGTGARMRTTEHGGAVDVWDKNGHRLE